jgi:hypothetical protein
MQLVICLYNQLTNSSRVAHRIHKKGQAVLRKKNYLVSRFSLSQILPSISREIIINAHLSFHNFTYVALALAHIIALCH